MKKHAPAKGKEARTPKRKSPPAKAAKAKAPKKAPVKSPSKGDRDGHKPGCTFIDDLAKGIVHAGGRVTDKRDAAPASPPPALTLKPGELYLAYGQVAKYESVRNDGMHRFVNPDTGAVKYVVHPDDVDAVVVPYRAPLPVHPLAAKIPMADAEDYESLKQSIIAAGKPAGLPGKIIHPAVLFEGKLLDGRTRNLIACELGIDFPVEEFDPVKHAATPLEYVIQMNTRRNLKAAQKACLAVEFMEELAPTRKVGRPSENERNAALIKGKSSEIAAARFGIKPRMVEMVAEVRDAAPEIFRELMGGKTKLTVNAALNRAKQAKAAKAIGEAAAASPISYKKSDCRLVHGDNVAELKALHKEGVEVDLVFFDPPYNNGWGYDADPHGDALPRDKYLDGLRAVVAGCVKLLRPNGSIYVLVDDANSDDVGMILRAAGLHRRGCIVWWETFANHNPGTFTCCTRYVHYYTRSATDYVWTPALVPSARLSVYGDARANPAGKVPDNVWPISRKQGTAADRVPFEDAPPQVPVEVPARCIAASSPPGGLVLDPYNGNGTTGVAALLNGRRYVGIDRSAKYLKQSEQWIASQLKPQQPPKPEAA